jgi:hypothetical protein
MVPWLYGLEQNIMVLKVCVVGELFHLLADRKQRKGKGQGTSY